MSAPRSSSARPTAKKIAKSRKAASKVLDKTIKKVGKAKRSAADCKAGAVELLTTLKALLNAIGG